MTKLNAAAMLAGQHITTLKRQQERHTDKTRSQNAACRKQNPPSAQHQHTHDAIQNIFEHNTHAYNSHPSHLDTFSPDLSRIQEVMSHGLAKNTQAHYRSAVNLFLEFCDKHAVPPDQRLPASENVLCSFAASLASNYSGSYASGIFSGLRTWHIVHNSQWNGSGRLHIILRGISALAPLSSKRAPRLPVTRAMLIILREGLNMESREDVSVFATAVTTFWTQCRLGEILGTARLKHSPSTLPSRNSLGDPFTNAGSRELKLPSTKNNRFAGESVTILRQLDLTDPIAAIDHHLRLNPLIPETHHLFAYTSYKNNAHQFRCLTKETFLARCNQIWSARGFPNISGHAFRIGGTSELLRQGIAPELVRKMGRWASDAHLRYWRDTKFIAADHAEPLPNNSQDTARSATLPAHRPPHRLRSARSVHRGRPY